MRYLFYPWLIVLLVACEPAPTPEPEPAPRPPNVVLVFVDDLGYADLSGYGNPLVETPHLDRLAREGQQWTSFYTASSVCSPSRGALLTGRYPVRIGLAGDRHRVFFPQSRGGLDPAERTIAELLRARGYATACIGKWHLGHLPRYLPTNQGFDRYFGIPYSNDMDAVQWGLETLLGPPDIHQWNVPLLRDTAEVERPADQFTITRRYTEAAIDFMTEKRDSAFFLYLPHSMVHTPLFAGAAFQNSSVRGRYGDVLHEVDWSVGQLTAALDRLGLRERTLFIFTSDNGPWLLMREHGGSAGPFRDGKGTTWEGGHRVPGIFYQPGAVQPGRVTGMGSTLDLLPTIAAWTGSPLPTDRPLDGVDLSPTLRTGAPSPRDHFFFYRQRELYAARLGPYKAHYQTATAYAPDNGHRRHDPPLLYHLEHDPGERYDRAAVQPEVLARIDSLVRTHRAGVAYTVSELDRY